MESHIADGTQRHFSRVTGVLAAGHFLGFCASFLLLTHCFLPLLPSAWTKDALGEFLSVRVCACGDGLAFSGSAFGIFFAFGGFRAGSWSRASWGFRFRFILAQVGPHRSINTA